jgi:histidine triad (HIT) family protein
MAHYDWFCDDVLSGKLEVKPVWQDDRVLAFHHPRPKSKVHVVVIPKAHVTSIMEPEALDPTLLTSMVEAVQRSARLLGLDRSGFFVKTNAIAPGVTPHMHWHLRGPGVD